MSTVGSVAFGELLRRYRVKRGLTQEELAERAGLSAQAIGALERGQRRRPHRDTLELLATALALGPEEQAAFAQAARSSLPVPGASEATAPAGLPVPLTPLIGREREQREIAALLCQPDMRLVTLTGPGGVGKTRLALAVATEAATHFPDGVVLVPLAALADHRLVLSAVAQALSVREAGDQSLLETLATHLAAKGLLVVLDNMEHLRAAASDIAVLLERCLRLKVLATSRASLRLRGEREMAVAPLALPDRGRRPAADELEQVPAVALFCARARDRLPGFQITPAAAAAVAGICWRLDGLPLALELAAARITLLPPQALLARLERRLPLLTGGAVDLPARQQTMRGAIAWSYDLLRAGEQALFRRLAIFAGGCTLSAVEAVCNTASDLEGDLLDWLGALLDHSLLHREPPLRTQDWSALQNRGTLGVAALPGTDLEPRYAMLETIREYGLEQLAARGEAEVLGRRHALYYLALAEEAEPHLVAGPEQALWLAGLNADHDNLRAALRWTLQAGERTERDAPAREQERDARRAIGLRLAGALALFWYTHGHVSEGQGWLETLLSQHVTLDTAHSTVRAKALHGAGVLAWVQGDQRRAEALGDESVRLYREAGDTRGIIDALNLLGDVAHSQSAYLQAAALWEESLALSRELGDAGRTAAILGNLGLVGHYQGAYQRATSLYEESVALQRAQHDMRGSAITLNNLGLVAAEQGHYTRAEHLYEESLALSREIGFSHVLAATLNNLGRVRQEQGDPARAVALYEESLAVSRALGDRQSAALSLNHLGLVAAEQGAYARAAMFYRESLVSLQALGDRRSSAYALERWARMVWAQGQSARAARLFGAAAALRRAIAAPLPAMERASYDRAVAGIRAALGDDLFTTVWAAGEALSLTEAVADALRGVAPGALPGARTEEPTA